METHALRSALEERIASRDRAAAVALVLDAVGSGSISIPVLYRDVLGPLLVDTGKLWSAGERTVWEEHLTSRVVETVVESLYPEVVAAAPAQRRGRIVLACPAGEQHDLGLRMLADRLEIAGWEVFLLGADTPAEELAAAARALGANAVALSASTHFQRVDLRRYIERLRAALPDVLVHAGGPAFEGTGEPWDDVSRLDPDAPPAER